MSTLVDGVLRFTSNNGDGQKVLAAAGDIYAQLEALGASFAVEISLRPVASLTFGGESSWLTAPPAETQKETVSTLEDVTLFDEHLSRTTAANFQTAAPETPDEPPQVNARKEFLALSDYNKVQAVVRQERALTARLGHLPTISEWDDLRPAWMPKAGGLWSAKYGPKGWIQWQRLFETGRGTESGA